jgi:hypothetical protein
MAKPLSQKTQFDTEVTEENRRGTERYIGHGSDLDTEDAEIGQSARSSETEDFVGLGPEPNFSDFYRRKRR